MDKLKFEIPGGAVTVGYSRRYILFLHGLDGPKDAILLAVCQFTGAVCPVHSLLIYR
jgi:hypothetical protein